MPSFSKSVFVNCPFDPEYDPFYYTIVFTIHYLGLEARTSYEASDVGEPRILKLIRLISNSKYGIHDLSRCKARERGEFARLNMPLELGIDLGCRRFGESRQRKKKILVLDVHNYRFRRSVSDISGSDIKAYRNRRQLIRVVSHWLVQTAGASERSASEISAMQLRFDEDNFQRLRKRGHSVRDIQHRTPESIRRDMKTWIRDNRPHHAGNFWIWWDAEVHLTKTTLVFVYTEGYGATPVLKGVSLLKAILIALEHRKPRG